jgi:hypothetical protein
VPRRYHFLSHALHPDCLLTLRFHVSKTIDDFVRVQLANDDFMKQALRMSIQKYCKIILMQKGQEYFLPSWLQEPQT